MVAQDNLLLGVKVKSFKNIFGQLELSEMDRKRAEKELNDFMESRMVMSIDSSKPWILIFYKEDETQTNGK